MCENIWSIVGKPCTTHGWTIKILFFFLIFKEWEYFNKSSPRKHMVEQQSCNVDVVCNSRTLIDLKGKKIKNKK